jgi:hypothetical protein
MSEYTLKIANPQQLRILSSALYHHALYHHSMGSETKNLTLPQILAIQNEQTELRLLREALWNLEYPPSAEE